MPMHTDPAPSASSTPRPRVARGRLAAALAELSDAGGVVVCATDARFLGDYRKERAEVVGWCRGCPVFDACREAGQFEVFGVWAGQDRTPHPDEL